MINEEKHKILIEMGFVCNDKDLGYYTFKYRNDYDVLEAFAYKDEFIIPKAVDLILKLGIRCGENIREYKSTMKRLD